MTNIIIEIEKIKKKRKVGWDWILIFSHMGIWMKILSSLVYGAGMRWIFKKSGQLNPPLLHPVAISRKVGFLWDCYFLEQFPPS